MLKNYVQLDSKNKVFCVLQSNLIETEKIIEVPSYNTNLLNSFYINDNFVKIKLNNINAQINTLTQIPIKYQTFDLEQQKYITDESINKTVDVYLNDELATTEEIVNGEGVMQFESAEAGTFKIRVENVECEVIVNG